MVWNKVVEIVQENPFEWAGIFSAFVLCVVLMIYIKIKRKISVWDSFQYAVLIVAAVWVLPLIHLIEAASDYFKMCKKIFKGEI